MSNNTPKSADVSPQRITGFLPPIATPMQDGKLDIPSLHSQLDYISDHVAGYLVGGSIGEVASLTLEERQHVMRACADHSGSTRRLAVSVSDNCLANCRRLTETAAEVGADLVMVSSPNYFTNNRDMLVAYYGAIGEFSPTEICLYDNPIQSHTLLSVADIAAIAKAVPTLTHIKVTDTAIEKVAAIRAATDLVILAGDDAVLWHQLDRGAEGGMVALPLIYPQIASDVWDALQSGDRDAAYSRYSDATRFMHIAFGAADFVAVVKMVLHHKGVIASSEMRIPLVMPPAHRCAEILAAL